MIDKVIFDMIVYFDGDTKRINHAMKVYTLSKAIGSGVDDVNSRLILELSAILHDIGIHECERLHNSTSGKLQEKYSPPIAKEILSKYYEDDIIDKVCEIIGKHHSYENILGIEHQVLLEADLIVNYLEGDFTEAAFANGAKKIFRTDEGKSLLKEWIDKI